jgi:PAS domain S-box-containing protein
MSSTDIGRMEWNVDTGKASFDESWARIVGYTPRELTPPDIQTWFNLCHPDDFTELEKQIKKHLAGEIEKYLFELRMKHNSGEWITVLARGNVTKRDEAGNPLKLAGIIMDITDNKNKSIDSQMQENYYKRLIKIFPDGIIVHCDENIVMVNETGVKMLGGKSKNQFIGNSIWDFIHKESSKEFKSKIKEAYKAKVSPPNFQLELQKIDGKRLSVELSNARFTYYHKPAILSVFRDISRQKKIEKELKDSENRFRSINEAANDAIIIIGPDRNISFWNNSAEEVFGFSASEAIGRNLHEIIAPKRFYGTYHRAFSYFQREQKKYIIGRTVELIARRKVGKEIYIEVSLSSISFNDKWHVIAIIRDISDKKLAEKALKRERTSFMHLFENSPEAIVITESDGLIIRINNEFENLFGYSKKEVIGKKVDNLIVPQELKKDAAQITDKVMNAKLIQHETLRKRKDGSLIKMSVLCAPMQIEKKHSVIFWIYRDITDRKKTEEALMESEEKFRSLAESTPMVIALFQNNKWVYVNPASEKISGFSKNELYRMNYWDFIHRDFQKGFRELGRLCLLGKEKPPGCEIKIIRKDRRERWGYVFGSNTLYKGERVGLISIMDITERKETETQLQKAQRMEAVGQLTGGIAHDFNNLLQVISGYIQMVHKKLDDGDVLKKMLTKALNAEARAANLIKQLLAYSRRQVLKPVNLNVNKMISELFKMLRRIIGEQINQVFELSEDLKLINADPAMIEQVIMNVCINARDAMPKGGDLVIKTQNVFVDKKFISEFSWAIPGEYILLTISDTGKGMDEETLPHIFEPFFSTKEETRGTGLGLSMVYGIVKQHNGMILASSAPGKGSTFHIYFPIQQKAVKETVYTTRNKKMIYKGGDETILLAEDEEMVRVVTKSFLEDAGYTIFTAEDGIEALEIFKKKYKKIDMLILDVVMPGMSGIEAYQEIQKIKNVPVLMASGYSKNALYKNYIIKEGIPFIEKPFSYDKLLDAIRQTLLRGQIFP